MRPLLAPGARLRVRPAGVAAARPGDVVVVDCGDRLVAHRLLYVTRAGFVTRGDNSPDDDGTRPHAALIGVVEIEPGPRALYAALRVLLRCPFR
jgi:hypothetical protein